MKLDEIFTFENLYNAHKKCRISKSHKREVVDFEVNLTTNIYKIIDEMKTKKYKVGKYRSFYIYEPKERLIEALPYKDRVIVRCFCDNSILPKIDKRLIYDNAACRKGKGTLFAIKRLESFLKKEYVRENNNNIYYLKCDIRKYFPSINHDILLNLLKRVNFSDDEMWLIEKYVRSKASNENSGLPLGNQTSQWFALFYLDIVDRYIKEKLKVKYYIRYMDDMILIHRDKNYLRYCLGEIRSICESKLNLSLNSKTQIGKVSNGIDFLGYRNILTSSGKVIRKLRQSSKIRMKRHLKTLDKLHNNNIVDKEYVDIRKHAYKEHIKVSNESKEFIEKLL